MDGRYYRKANILKAAQIITLVLIIIVIGGIFVNMNAAFRQYMGREDFISESLYVRTESLQEEMEETMVLLVKELETRKKAEQNLFRLEEAIEEINQIMSAPDSKIGGIMLRLLSIEDDITSLSLLYSELVKALNPSSQKEILTVARLGDRFDLLEDQQKETSEEVSKMENDVDARMLRNQDRVEGQIDRLVGLFKWFAAGCATFLLYLLTNIMTRRGSASPAVAAGQVSSPEDTSSDNSQSDA